MTRQLRSFFWSVPLVLFVGCGDSPVSGTGVSPPLDTIAETDHIVFHTSAGDRVDMQWQEAYHEWAVAELGVSPTRKIQYFKYRDRAHISALTGSQGNAWADPSTFSIHTIWPQDNHEVVHLYSSLKGSPAALFNEGFAVAHQVDPSAGDFVPKWSSVPVHEWARRFLSENRLVPIGSLLETTGFRRFDDSVTYPEAGSFIRFLIDDYGLDEMFELFGRGSPQDTAAAIRSSFLDVYGFSIETAERRWLAFLQSGTGRDSVLGSGAAFAQDDDVSGEAQAQAQNRRNVPDEALDPS